MTNKYVKVGNVYVDTTTGNRISIQEYKEMNETNTETKKTTRKNSRAKTK